MRRVWGMAAAVLVLGGMATGPAVAAPKDKPPKDRSPKIELHADTLHMANVLTFQCTGTVEHATAAETFVDSCRAFRNGALVAEAVPARAQGGSASSDRWTGVVSGGGTVTVCMSAIAKLSTGELLAGYACD